MSPSEPFNQISPSEFFYRNRDLAGFSNPTRSMYTAVREFVENGLDACDQSGILPDIHLTIRAVDGERRDPKPYILTVRDNGPGMDAEHIPLAFGTVLYGSKFGLKQARGMFGLGATMAILYGQITTNRPVSVRSSTAEGGGGDEYDLLLDIQKNKPVVLRHRTGPVKKGLSVSIQLEGDYSKAGAKVRDYVYQTSLITPYASITFDDPKGERYRYPRIVRSMPPAPTAIRPHPFGVDVETIRRMIAENAASVPAVDDALAAGLRAALGMKDGEEATVEAVLERAEKRSKKLKPHMRAVVSLMALLGMDLDRIGRIRVEDIDAGGAAVTYRDFAKSETVTTGVDAGSPHFKPIAAIAAGETLGAFLTKRFQRVGPSTAAKFAEFAGFKPGARVGLLGNEDLVRLSDSLQRYGDFHAPDPTCLAPLGAEPLEKGMQKFFDPDFAAVVQRPASAYSGFPFVVEMGIAYGGGIQTRGVKVYRFANRIPLLYDEGSDVVLKVAGDIDWKRYAVGPEPPLVVASHICSTRIPYKTVGKENVADRPEIEKELRLAMQFLLRKLASYMKKRGRAEAARKRADLYSKYVPLIAQFCTELAGKKAEPDCAGLLRAASEELGIDGGGEEKEEKGGGKAEKEEKGGGKAEKEEKGGGEEKDKGGGKAEKGGKAAGKKKGGGGGAGQPKKEEGARGGKGGTLTEYTGGGGGPPPADARGKAARGAPGAGTAAAGGAKKAKKPRSVVRTRMAARGRGKGGGGR